MPPIFQLCELLTRVPPSDREEVMCRIHNVAGRLACQTDSDQTAILLEALADDTNDVDLKRLCYTHALYRATWCAQEATSGGEGLSRSADVKRIKAKCDIAGQRDPANPPTF
jgi:hypothetical protein